jgi:hypothetical protein
MINAIETPREIRTRIEGNLAQATPVEIDTVLSELWDAIDRADNAEAIAQQVALEIKETIDKVLAGETFVGSRYYTSARDGIRLMQRFVKAQEDIAKYRARAEKYVAMAKPFEDEYERRGRWNRVFLAKSHNGHAHNGMDCSTCNNGEQQTQFAWLVQYSGMKESEIVADAGERACTTCYKSAPAADLLRPTKMFTPDEEEAQRRREERKAELARKAQEAADKSITTPEGGVLYEDRSNSWKIKNIRTAEIAATDALKDLILEQRYAADPELDWMYEKTSREQRSMEYARHAWCLIRSIAAKKGLTFQEVFEVHEKKAQAKVRKADRDWAKDPRNPNRTK